MKKFYFILCFLLFFSEIAFSDNLDFKVDVIIASTNGSYVDESLYKIKRKLNRLFKFSSYYLIKKERIRFLNKKTSIIDLPEDLKLSLEYVYKNGNSYGLKAKITGIGKTYVNTRFEIRKSGSFFIGGIKLKNGVLIIRVYLE